MTSSVRWDAFKVLDELRFKVEKITQIHTFDSKLHKKFFNFWFITIY